MQNLCLGCRKPIKKNYGQWSAGYTCSHACNETYIKGFKANVQKPPEAKARRVASKSVAFQVKHDSEGTY